MEVMFLLVQGEAFTLTPVGWNARKRLQHSLRLSAALMTDQLPDGGPTSELGGSFRSEGDGGATFAGQMQPRPSKIPLSHSLCLLTPSFNFPFIEFLECFLSVL